MDYRFLDINGAFFETKREIAKKKELNSTPLPLTTEMFKSLVKTDFFQEKQNLGNKTGSSASHSNGTEEMKPQNSGIYDKSKTNVKKRKNPEDEQQTENFFSSSSLLNNEFADCLAFSDFMDFRNGKSPHLQIENQATHFELIKNSFIDSFKSFFSTEEQRFSKNMRKKRKISETDSSNDQFVEESIETKEKNTSHEDFEAPEDKIVQKIVQKSEEVEKTPEIVQNQPEIKIVIEKPTDVAPKANILLFKPHKEPNKQAKIPNNSTSDKENLGFTKNRLFGPPKNKNMNNSNPQPQILANRPQFPNINRMQTNPATQRGAAVPNIFEAMMKMPQPSSNQQPKKKKKVEKEEKDEVHGTDQPHSTGRDNMKGFSNYVLESSQPTIDNFV